MRNRPLKSKKTVDLFHIRLLIANYMESEGCDCCQKENHDADKDALAKLLGVPVSREGSRDYFAKFVKREE